jgi:N-methylhydantoinase B/oxoprolinase/acetone carboxylase alpha subunit
LGKAMVATWREWRNIRDEREKLADWTAKTYSFETMADRIIELCQKVSQSQYKNYWLD